MAGILQAIKFAKKSNIGLVLKSNPYKLKLSNQVRSFGSKANHVQKSNLVTPLFKSLIGTGLVVGGTVYIAKENIKLQDYLKDTDILNTVLGFFISFAKCDDSGTKHRRTDHYEKTISSDNNKDAANKKKDPEFDWKEFFQLIWKEKFYMLAAVAVGGFSV